MIDQLIKQVRKGFKQISDHRRDNASYDLSDLLSAGFAIFSLKDPSLLAFRENFPNRSDNLKRIYGIEHIPGDTALREGLDGISVDALKGVLQIPLDQLRQEGVLPDRYVLGNYLAISCDGTGHYCSSKKKCPHCLVKKHRNGSETYYHQLLAGVMVHPEQATVFPVGCEPIVNQDGSTKNDCEQNAAKRLLPQIRSRLPDDELLMVFDALYASGPHIRALQKNRMSYLIGIKEGFVLIQVDRLKQNPDDQLKTLEWKAGKKQCKAIWANDLILSGQHQDLKVNYLEYTEVNAQTGRQSFFSSWITDIFIDVQNVKEMVGVARARWKIENETFNTLKNQGYHLEHNYGHGKKNLTSNFAVLTILAFLVDQIAQHLDQNFQEACKRYRSRRNFWEKVRQVFDLLPAMSMNAIYKFIAKGAQIDFPLLE